MKYLRYFKTYAEYQAAINNLDLPNVSAVKEKERAYFHRINGGDEGGEGGDDGDDNVENVIVVENNILALTGTVSVNNNVLSLTSGRVENNILIL